MENERTTMINFSEWLNAWRYYCALVAEFENTIQYVDDTMDEDGKLCNGNTYSNEFYNLLFKAAAEFENLGKTMCSDIEHSDCASYNIVCLSKSILNKYPQIIDTQLRAPSGTIIRPLKNWKINSMRVEGIEWWRAYNNVKHGRYKNFKEANFQNCFDAISSLLVLELYAGRMTLKENFLFEISTNISRYFKYDYYRDLIFPLPIKLPDEMQFDKLEKDI